VGALALLAKSSQPVMAESREKNSSRAAQLKNAELNSRRSTTDVRNQIMPEEVLSLGLDAQVARQRTTEDQSPGRGRSGEQATGARAVT
jgi:hypothetical protein